MRLMSTKNLIINAVGSDRTGIISDMTKNVIEVGGNVGESKAARLGKYFSLMMVVKIPEEHVSKLSTQLETMVDLNAAIFETSEDDATASAANPAIACTCTHIPSYHETRKLSYLSGWEFFRTHLCCCPM